MRVIVFLYLFCSFAAEANWNREHWKELDRQIQYERHIGDNNEASSTETESGSSTNKKNTQNWLVKEKEDWTDIRREPNRKLWQEPQHNDLPPWMTGSSKNDEEARQINEQTRRESERSRSSSSTPRSRSADVQLENPAWLQVLLWVAVAIVVGILAYFIFKALRKPRSKKIRRARITEDVSPVEIPLSELDRALQEYLKAKEYRKAVRILFLYVLKQLGEKELIVWKKEKTNHHYYNELISKGLSEHFGRIATVYEWVWYGERHPDDKIYQRIDADFRDYLRKIE